MELIDTDVLIDVQRGFDAAADWFATDPDVGDLQVSFNELTPASEPLYAVA